MADKELRNIVAIENIYNLDGRVPLGKAVPFGLQHVMAMFLPNIAPIIIIATASGLGTAQQAMLIQNAMVVAGIASLLQLYPVWRIGAKLPIIMGVSFTFVAVLCSIGAKYGYPAVVGAVLIGGIFEGCLGLTATYWRRIISPVVSATVVTTTGITLLAVGARSFGGGYSPDFGSATNLLIGSVTLVSCLLVSCFAKGFWKQLSILGGLIVGYILSILLGRVDFSLILSGDIVSLPHLLPFTPEFHVGPILSIAVIFLVSAAETIGDTSAMVATGLNRDITEKEISGSLGCDGFGSSISSLFGCAPVTSFSQNVGLIAMTKVVNRFTIMTGALCMVLAGLFPPLGAFFATLPDAVLGGCTIMMFGSIVMGGVQMFGRDGFTQRNVTIAALSIAMGVGFTGVPEIFSILPTIAQDVFANNSIALSFIVSVVLNLVLPEDMEVKRVEAEK
ncbi:MAG: purine permease [Synergistaceae bacterium]|jgi:NCS2 family nucleobase:cation symporter-2|nr:purine permease [Synergistaceae bacterium]